MATTSVIPQGIVSQRREEQLANSLLQHFGEKELMAVRLVSRSFRSVAERYLLQRFTSFSGASSIGPSQLNSLTLKGVIMQKLQTMPAGSTARVASDQITDEHFFRSLLGPSITITVKVNVGSQAPNRGVSALYGNALQVKGPQPDKGKAHAKFLSGGGGVLVGSPNFTPTALSGKTVESVVHIRNLRVQAYFNRYFELMRSHNPADELVFKRMLTAFNASSNNMSLALAPYVAIQPWLDVQLKGADRLIIRMFLISNLRDGNDIVTGLNTMARNNPRMAINVYIDQGQFENAFTTYFYRGEERRNYYVQEACATLLKGAPNVKVFTQTGTDGIMHDKLILAEKDIKLPDGSTGVARRVMVGSSGFTTNVMLNQNWEVMVRVDDDKLYEYMMKHHLATKAPGFNTKQIK